MIKRTYFAHWRGGNVNGIQKEGSFSISFKGWLANGENVYKRCSEVARAESGGTNVSLIQINRIS